MAAIQLTYLMATKNKLFYLKQVLPRLIEAKRKNEEILIADGASTDGTKDYLESLKIRGEIDNYISEADSGEAHALNKLFLMAKGEFITMATDDDVIDFNGIQAMKNFMLNHSEIDYVGSEGGSKDMNINSNVRPIVYENNYRRWRKDHIPFATCGLGLVFRRSSIPLLGLWNSSYKQLDTEFTLRNSSGMTNIAWYTGHSYVNISGPQSTTLVYSKRIKREGETLRKFYFDAKPNSFIRQKFNALRYKIKSNSLFREKRASSAPNTEWENLAKISEEWLKRTNSKKNLEFLFRQQ